MKKTIITKKIICTIIFISVFCMGFLVGRIYPEKKISSNEVIDNKKWLFNNEVDAKELGVQYYHINEDYLKVYENSCISKEITKDSSTMMNTSTDLVWENNELDFNGNGVCDYSKIEIVSTSEAMCDIVTIVLDDGSKYSLKYEGRNSDKEDFITVRAAKIISSTRDSLVIEITDTKSNYGSTDLHVLSLRENDKGMDEVLTILDNKDKIDEFISSYYPLDIINITITEEEQLICFDNQICKNMIQVTVYEKEPIFLFWQDDSWKIK